MTITFSPALQQHVAELCPVLRGADRREVQALTGAPPEIALSDALAASDAALAVHVNGEIAGIFGVEPVFSFPQVGVVWFVGSNVVSRHSHAFQRLSRSWLEGAHRRHPLLTNRVDARNELHIRWLRRMGFSLVQRIDHWGAERRPFIEFAKLCA